MFEVLRDTTLLSPRILRACVEVQRGRLRGRGEKRLQNPVSAKWLAAELGIDPALIEEARIENVHHGTASRSRLHLRYSPSSGATPGPRTLFVKSDPPDFGSALFGVLLDLGGNEVSFYRHLRSGLPIDSPEAAYAFGSSSRYELLLEDLAEAGCEFRNIATSCSVGEAESVVEALAKLHAHYWQSERFQTDLGWVKRYESGRDARLLNLIRRVSIPIAVKRYGGVIPDQVRAAIPEVLARYPLLEERWAEEPRTLIHGDAHLGNIYFRDGKPGFFDWQVHQLGQGMRDISYFLINSLEEEVRLEKQDELIALYLERLRESGVSLDPHTAWRQYRLQSVYAWIAGIVTAPSNFQPEEVVVAGLSRSCNALIDLDAIGLLREL